MIINGLEYEIDFFETDIKPGQAMGIDTVDALMEEEQIEKDVQAAVEEIRTIRNKYNDIEKNISYHYEVGEVLQFIEGFEKRHGNRSQIFNRMAVDLEPKLFFGDRELKKEKAVKQLESRRVIEKMYLLGKFDKRDLGKASWNQWDEIVKFKDLGNQKDVLKKVFELCAKGMTSVSLRKEIKKLRSK